MERESLYTIFDKVLGGHSEDFSEFAKAYDDINKSLVRAKRSERDLAVEVLNEMTQKNEIDSVDAKLYVDFIDALNKRKATRAPEVHFKKKLSSDGINFEDGQVSLWIIYLDRLKAMETISHNKLRVMDKAVAAAKLFKHLIGLKDTNQRYFINSYYTTNLNRIHQELKYSLDRESDMKSHLEQKDDIIKLLEDQSALKDREIQTLKDNLSKEYDLENLLEQRLNNIQRQFIVKDGEIQALQGTVEHNNYTIERLRCELIKLQDELTKTQEDNHNTVETLRSKYAKLQSQLSKAQHENNGLTQELEKKTDLFKDFESKNESLEHEIHEKDKAISAFKDKLNKLDRLADSLRTQLEEKENMLEDANNRIHNYQSEIEKAKKDLDGKNQALRNLNYEKEEAISQLEGKAADLQKELSDKLKFVDYFKDASNKLKEQEDHITSLSADLHSKEEALADLGEAYNSLTQAKETLENNLLELKNQDSEKEATLSQKDHILAELEKHVDFLKSDGTEKEKLIENYYEATKKIADLEQALEQINKDIHDKDEALANSYQLQTCMKEQAEQGKDAYETSIQDLKQSISKKDTEISQLENKIDVQGKLIEALNNDLSNLGRELVSNELLNKKIEELEKLIEYMKKELKDSENALKCLDYTHNAYMSEVSRNNQEFENHLQELKIHITEKDENISNLSHKFQNLQQDFEDLKTNYDFVTEKPKFSEEEVLFKVKAQDKQDAEFFEDEIEGEFTFIVSGKITADRLQMKAKTHSECHEKDLVWECELKQIYLKSELQEKEKLIKKLIDEIKIKNEAAKVKSDSQGSYDFEHSYLIRELELRIKHLNSELETKDDIIALLKSQSLDYSSSHHVTAELELEEILRLQEEYREQIHSYNLQVTEYESKIQNLKKEILDKSELCTKLQRDYKDQIGEIEKQINHYEKHLNTLYMHNEYSGAGSGHDLDILYQNIHDGKGYNRRIQFFNRDIYLRTQILERVLRSQGFESKVSMEGYIPIPISLESVIYLEGHSAEITCIHSSPDGKYVATASIDRSVRIWDVVTRNTVDSFEGHLERVNAVAISWEGKHIASGSAGGSIKIWNIQDSKEEIEFTDSKNSVLSLAWLRDDDILISGHTQGLVLLWSISKKELIGRLDGHSGDVVSLAVTPDGKRAVTASRSGSVRLWSPESQSEVAMLLNSKESITSLALSNDGKYIIIGFTDGKIKVLNILDIKEQYDLVTHCDSIISLTTSKCAKFIISSSKDNTIRFWDTRERKVATVLNERNYNFTHVAAINSGKSIVFGTDTGKVGIWWQDLNSF